MNKRLKVVEKADGTFGSAAATAALKTKLNELMATKAGSAEYEKVQADIHHLLRGLHK